MNQIIEKTYELIDTLDSSDLIKKIVEYKTRINNNPDLLKLIEKCNHSENTVDYITIKKQIYKYEEYQNYINYYNQLYYIIYNMNNRYKKLLEGKGCNL